MSVKINEEVKNHYFMKAELKQASAGVSTKSRVDDAKFKINAGGI